MAKSSGDFDEYLKRLGAVKLKTALDSRLLEFDSDTEDEYPDDEHDEEEDSSELRGIQRELERLVVLSGSIPETKAEIGDIRRRLEEMRLKLDLIQKNVLDTTKELKEQFTKFNGLVFANQQLQEGMKELKETNKVITAGVDAKVAERTKYVHLTEDRLKDLDKVVKELKSENRHLNSQTKQLRKANHEIRTERNKIECRLEQLAEVKLNEYQPVDKPADEDMHSIKQQIQGIIGGPQND